MYNSAINCSEGATLIFFQCFFDEIKDFDKEIRAQSINTPKLEIGMVEHTGRGTSLFLVSIMLGSLFSVLPTTPINAEQETYFQSSTNLFQGFTTGDNWLNLNNQTIAVPTGFNVLDVYDYSDVGVLINNKSDASKTIGWAFVQARNISLNVFIFDLKERQQGRQLIEIVHNLLCLPFLDMLNNRSNVSDMNYLVTSKGMPLRVSGGQNKASFDQNLFAWWVIQQ